MLELRILLERSHYLVSDPPNSILGRVRTTELRIGFKWFIVGAARGEV